MKKISSMLCIGLLQGVAIGEATGNARHNEALEHRKSAFIKYCELASFSFGVGLLSGVIPPLAPAMIVSAAMDASNAKGLEIVTIIGSGTAGFATGCSMWYALYRLVHSMVAGN